MSRPHLPLITWEQGEDLAADYLRTRGYHDARVTQRGADHGVDVEGSRVIAQVKFTAVPAGRPAVQQLVGANFGGHRHAVFFSLAGFSKGAVTYADDARVALFRYTKSGLVEPVNASAWRIHANYVPPGGQVHQPGWSSSPEKQNLVLTGVILGVIVIIGFISAILQAAG